MCSAVDAIQRSLECTGSASGWAATQHDARSSATVVIDAFAHGNHGRGIDGLLETDGDGSRPNGDDRAVPEPSDGHRGEDELLTRQAADVMLEIVRATPAQCGAEHAGVDNESQESIASANASSSSSYRSSISRLSSEPRTGAERSCSEVRSRGNRVVPCDRSV